MTGADALGSWKRIEDELRLTVMDWVTGTLPDICLRAATMHEKGCYWVAFLARRDEYDENEDKEDFIGTKLKNCELKFLDVVMEDDKHSMKDKGFAMMCGKWKLEKLPYPVPPTVTDVVS